MGAFSRRSLSLRCEKLRDLRPAIIERRLNRKREIFLLNRRDYWIGCDFLKFFLTNDLKLLIFLILALFFLRTPFFLVCQGGSF